MATPDQQRIPPAGIEGSELKGPFPVGEYADALRTRLRELARVQVFGEVSNLGIRAKAVYFEQRAASTARACSSRRSCSPAPRCRARSAS